MARAFSNTNHRTQYDDGGTSFSLDYAQSQFVVPKNWKGDNTVPLIIYCHGAGEDALLPMDPSRFGQQGNITALAEAGWPVFLADLGGKETWARQNSPTLRQINWQRSSSAKTLGNTFDAPAQPRSLIRLIVSYTNAGAPVTPTISPAAGWTLRSSGSNGGNNNQYIFDRIAVGGEISYVSNITITGSPMSARLEEYTGWAGTPTPDYNSLVGSAAGQTQANDMFVFTPQSSQELAIASIFWGGTTSAQFALWGSSSNPPGLPMSATISPVTADNTGMATISNVGAISGAMGTSFNWTTSRNVVMIDNTYYDVVTAPDFTNAFTVINYINNAITWAHNNFGAKISKIGIMGTSMGSLNALYFAAHNTSLVKAVCGVGPIVDLNDMVANNRGGFASIINSCYPGGYSNATYGSNHDPTTMATNGLFGTLPIQLWYGTSDTIAIPSRVTNFQSILGGSCQINPLVGGHAESTWNEVDTDSLVSFFLSNLGLT